MPWRWDELIKQSKCNYFYHLKKLVFIIRGNPMRENCGKEIETETIFARTQNKCYKHMFFRLPVHDFYSLKFRPNQSYKKTTFVCWPLDLVTVNNKIIFLAACLALDQVHSFIFLFVLFRRTYLTKFFFKLPLHRFSSYSLSLFPVKPNKRDFLQNATESTVWSSDSTVDPRHTNNDQWRFTRHE